MNYKKEFGDWGERIAKEECLKRGYRVIAENFHTKSGEVDILVFDPKRSHYYFIEVKTCSGETPDNGFANLTPRKLKRVKRAGEYFLNKEFGTIKDYEIHAIVIHKKNTGETDIFYLDELEL